MSMQAEHLLGGRLLRWSENGIDWHWSLDGYVLAADAGEVLAASGRMGWPPVDCEQVENVVREAGRAAALQDYHRAEEVVQRITDAVLPLTTPRLARRVPEGFMPDDGGTDGRFAHS